MRNRQRLGLRYAIDSDTGIVRQVNEDSVFASPRLLAVADGMGGHAHGEVASAVTVGVLAELDHHLRSATVDPLPVLATTVARVLRRLTDLAADDDELAGMGSTLTALLWDGATFGIAHVGDSRGYLVRDDTLSQLTRDHTLVQSLVDDGQISAAQAETHPRRSTLMRALQAGGAAEPDLSVHHAAPGDRYLLCSDGVTCVVGPDLLHNAMTTLADPAEVVKHLISEAKRLHSPDNISCVVADVVTSAPSREVLVGGAATAEPDQAGRLTRWARRLISR
ncbi:MAG TPA: protein phosphatase 2C domain-containing protein [Pseudonocardiaceae bacterium]|nr:protein phosphatase 2C domain-containing protein [Pseudonocardiaceae bacterium]